MQKLILKEATGADIPEEVVTRRKDRCIQNLLKLRFLSLRQIQCFYTACCTGHNSFASAETKTGCLCGRNCFLKIVIQIP